MSLEFIPLLDEHYIEVKEVYDYYILNSTATFHTEPISVEELKHAIPQGDGKYGSYLLKFDGQTCGYCYMCRYKNRQAYDRSAEVTLYLKPEFSGKGIGLRVLEFMEEKAQTNGIKVLLGIIAGDNESSIKLFERKGYEKCAHFRGIGEKFGKVLDVVGYQKTIF